MKQTISDCLIKKIISFVIFNLFLLCNLWLVPVGFTDPMDVVLVHSDDFKTIGVLFTNGQIDRTMPSLDELQYTAEGWPQDANQFSVKRYTFDSQQDLAWFDQLVESLKAYTPETETLPVDRLRLSLLGKESQTQECVTASDTYAEPVDNLARVVLGPVTITQALLPDGTASRLRIADCNGDGLLDISVPWSEASASQFATIQFSPLACGSLAAANIFPRKVEIYLQHGNQADLKAYDAFGNAVDGVSVPSGSPQVATLSSSSGIQKIVIVGSEICISKICWYCDGTVSPTDTPTPRPSGENCVTGDNYTGDALTDLAEINVPPVTIKQALLPDGTASPLSITDCNNDGQRDFWIPWSDSTAAQNAVILFRSTTCPSITSTAGYPKKVELYLPYGNNTIFEAKNPLGVIADSQTAAGTSPQIVTLTSLSGISEITVIGSQVCISKICWYCDSVIKPTPTLPETGDCITGDNYIGRTYTDLAQINVPPVTILQGYLADGTAVPLSVTDCNGDGARDFSIPWTESSASKNALIQFSPQTCGEVAGAVSYPYTVEIYLQHGNQAIFKAIDPSGTTVDSVSVPAGSPQVATLTSSSQIKEIVVIGSEICITKICWYCKPIIEKPTPTPIPIGDNCITGENYTGAVTTNLAQINVPPVTILQGYLADGTAVPLSVTDCDGDGLKDFSIPWTESSASKNALIQFSPKTCMSVTGAAAYPYTVEIYLQHGNQAIFRAVDPSGIVVDSVSVPAGSPQVATLTSSSQIKEIVVIGSEICITKICWYCKPIIEKPTPTPIPVGDNCITGENYTGAVSTNLAQINVPPVTILQGYLADGTAVPLSVTDCDGDGLKDFSIPWTESSASKNALIQFSPKTCMSVTGAAAYPYTVEIYLQHGNQAIFKAIDPSGITVDSVSVPAGSPQVATLTSSTQIKEIVVIGSEICITKICWYCKPIVEKPTPTPIPAGDNCITADNYTGSVLTGLAQISVYPITITQGYLPDGTAAPLSIMDCDDNGTKDFFVPWTEAHAYKNALIQFSEKTCMDDTGAASYPYTVEIYLQHTALATFQAVDPNGNTVDSVTVPSGSPQIATLSSSTQIKEIVIIGSEICITKICWYCKAIVKPTVTPIPTEGDCVTGENYTGDALTDLPEIKVLPVTIREALLPDGTPSLLSITDCNGDGQKDFWIPWSDTTAMQNAVIEFLSTTCPADAFGGNGYPRTVELYVPYGNNVTYQAKDPSGTIVDSQVAAGTNPQVVTLMSSSGIREITVIGSQVCISKICWYCDVITKPTPTPIEGIEKCVEASQYYNAPATDLSIVALGPVTITEAILPTGAPAKLSVTNCDEDSALDVWVPWTESSAVKKALITFDNTACAGAFPTTVIIFMTHGTAVALEALDGGGTVVDGAVSASSDPTFVETFVLTSSAGIRTVRLEGAEICIKRICWRCGNITEPTPTPPEQKLECVEPSQYFRSAVSSAERLTMGPVSIFQAIMQKNIPVPLQVLDCDKDGLLDLNIPWTESTAAVNAYIEFSQEACGGAFPEQVEIVLRHGTPIKLEALDKNGNVVDTASDAGSDFTILQTFKLLSSDGIQRVRIIGSEICIQKICWLCKADTVIQSWPDYN